MQHAIRGWARDLLDFVLPAVCVICRRPRTADSSSFGIICGLCMGRIAPIGYPICERCGHPRLSKWLPVPSSGESPEAAKLPSQGILPECRWCPLLVPFVRSVRSVCWMDRGTGGELVHALKYGGWHVLADPMAQKMSHLDWPEDVLEERAALVPMPLSRPRLRERGYNQAEVLARALGKKLNLPVWTEVLERIRHSKSQVQLTPSQRAGNVSGAFVVPDIRRTQVRGRHLVLVDDVVTTGATLNAAATALFEGGARIISCVTFGRAPDSGDRASPDDDSQRN